MARLTDAYARLKRLTASKSSSVDVSGLRMKCEEAMCDDLNTPMVISYFFDVAKSINLVADGKETLSGSDIDELKELFNIYLVELLGLNLEGASDASNEAFKGAVDLLLEIRKTAKENKDWATSDRIRNELTALGFNVKDTKEGYEWSL